MEHRCHHDHANNNGFLMGLLVGVLLTLLLVTKKGRKILRMLTDEGIEKIEDLEKILQEKMADLDDAEEESLTGDDFSVAHPVSAPIAVSPSQNTYTQTEPIEKPGTHHPEHTSIHSVKPSPRRFFRGVPKRN